MILWYIRYIIVSNNWGRWRGEIQCDLCWNDISPWRLSCIKSHLPPVAKIIYLDGRIRVVIGENWFDQYGNDMPPWRIMYHSTPLTCCIDHTRKKKKKSEKTFFKGGTLLHDFVKIIMHTWYWQLSNKFSDLLIETLFAVKPQAYVV